MEAAISCKFHCKRLAEHWQGYWPATDPGELAADIEERLRAAIAAWSLKGVEPLDGGVVALTCAATQNGRPVVLKSPARTHARDHRPRPRGPARRDRALGGPPPHGGRAAASFGHVRDFAPSWEIPDSEAEEGPHPPRPPRRQRSPNERGLEGHRPQGRAGRPPRRRLGADRPPDAQGFPRDPGQAEATATRRLERYAEAAEMDLAKARELTRMRASAEAHEVNDPGWAAALRRMAAALG